MSLLLLTADMDGFRLLEQVGLEMDLPVISKPHRPVLHRVMCHLP